MQASNNNFALGTRAADLNADQFAFNNYMALLSGMSSINNGVTTTGNTVQNAPGTAIDGINKAVAPITGYGTTQTTGGGAPGAAGGAIAAAQVANLVNGSSDPYKLVNTSSVSNTPQYLLNGW